MEPALAHLSYLFAGTLNDSSTDLTTTDDQLIKFANNIALLFSLFFDYFLY